jgi:predicted lipid-binding transport protein (Tim44 family)
LSIELIILAAVAVFVISKLYSVLGQQRGAEPPRPRPQLREVTTPAPEIDPAQGEEERPKMRPHFTGPGAAGLEAINEMDPSFVPDDFIKGARKAYEMIVNAFADGDRDALKALVDEDVYEAYSDAITARGEAEPLRLARLRSARIVDATLSAPNAQASEQGGGQVARVSVSFEAELTDGERQRPAREVWTFKRPVQSQNPNWLLDEVQAAS